MIQEDPQQDLVVPGKVSETRRPNPDDPDHLGLGWSLSGWSRPSQAGPDLQGAGFSGDVEPGGAETQQLVLKPDLLVQVSAVMLLLVVWAAKRCSTIQKRSWLKINIWSLITAAVRLRT